MTELHRLALECGAMKLGETPQYIFSAEQLTRFVEAVNGSLEWSALLRKFESLPERA